MIDYVFLFIAAFFATTFSALAGGGAGLLQLPVLLFLGLPFASALATHKLATVALGVGATARNWREGNFEWRLSLLVLLAGVPGVIAGAYVILGFPEQYAYLALGLLTISIGVYSIAKPNLGQHHSPKNRSLLGYVLGGLIIFIIGFLNGSLASGTGLLLTLCLVQWFGLDYQRAVAHTLVLVGFVWNGSGALSLAFLTELKWEWVPVLLLASLLGGYLGAHIGVAKGNHLIKRAFETVTILTGLALIYSSLS